MIKLTKRQESILNFIQQNDCVANKEILKEISKEFDDVSRTTIFRELDFLLDKKFIIKKGQGRNVVYSVQEISNFLKYFNIEKYFLFTADDREVKENFNFDFFNWKKKLFSEKELKNLEKMNVDYKKRIKMLSSTILKKEFERLTIELSWKSSQIEGNTYSLIDTEILLKDNQEAKGHTRSEAVMILNHKKALDYARDKKSNFQELSIRKIENIHALLTKDLGVKKGIIDIAVGIVGTKYKPLDNSYQTREALEKAIIFLDDIQNPFEKAVFAILFISYIQPFEDGNKRTARILGNAILMAYNICPLSYRNVDKSDYKKAIILFYEQNSATAFKDLFREQYKFAVETYFRV